VIQDCEKSGAILGQHEGTGSVEWVQRELEVIGKKKPDQVDALLRTPQFGVKVANIPTDPPPAAFSIKDGNRDICFTSSRRVRQARVVAAGQIAIRYA
jgi:hypothetical protein